MAKPPMQAAEVRAHERVVLDVGSRWIGALVVFGVFCWLVLLLVRDHHHPDWQAGGRLAWSLTILAAVAFIARGIFLSRPVTAGHTIAAMVAVFAGLGAHVLSFDLLGNVLIAACRAGVDVADLGAPTTGRAAAGVGVGEPYPR